MRGEPERGHPAPAGVTLRRARAGDAGLVFGWRNLPDIVSLSGSGRTVTWDEHARWFESAVADPRRLLLIVEADGEPVGQVRLDRHARKRAVAVVTIYLVDGPQGGGWGRGLGTAALTRGIRLAREAWPDLASIEAHVLQRNENAARFFSKNGFEETGAEGDLRFFVLDMDRTRDAPESERRQ